MEQQKAPLYSLIYLVLAIITLPYRRTFKLYTWRPLRQIRAANGDRSILIPLVKEWKADKYNEFQSVQVAATFCSGAAFSCLPLARTTNAVWIAEALWYSSLICAITAIITSIQAKSILDDLPPLIALDSSLSESEVRRIQRTILRYKKTPGIKYWAMVFIWQYPSMTMAYAWLAFLAGLSVYICTPFIRRMPWQDRHKVAIVYLAVGGVGLVTYIFSASFVYTSEKDLEQASARMLGGSSSTPHADTNDGENGTVSRSANNVQLRAETGQPGPSIEERRGWQMALSKACGGFEGEEEGRRGAVGFDRSRKQLLY